MPHFITSDETCSLPSNVQRSTDMKKTQLTHTTRPNKKVFAGKFLKNLLRLGFSFFFLAYFLHLRMGLEQKISFVLSWQANLGTFF